MSKEDRDLALAHFIKVYMSKEDRALALALALALSINVTKVINLSFSLCRVRMQYLI